MSAKTKPTVQTYLLKMSKEDHITGVKCYSLRTSILPEIIATYAGCNDDYFIFEAEVESIFRDRKSGVVIDKNILFCKYVLQIDKNIKHYKLIPETLYKITYNKIEKHD
jgi:hypothetical protein